MKIKARRSLFVKLPPEDYTPGYVGKLLKAMYGTRDAAHNWEYEYRDFMGRVGFESCYASPCLFWHKARNIRGVRRFHAAGRKVEFAVFQKSSVKEI